MRPCHKQTLTIIPNHRLIHFVYFVSTPWQLAFFFSCQTQYNLWNQCWGNPCHLAKFSSREKHSSKIIKWATDLFKKHPTSPSADNVYWWPTIFKKTQAFSPNEFQKEIRIIHFLTKDFPNQKCQQKEDKRSYIYILGELRLLLLLFHAIDIWSDLGWNPFTFLHPLRTDTHNH